MRTCRKCSALFNGRNCKECRRVYDAARSTTAFSDEKVKKMNKYKADWAIANAEKRKESCAAYYRNNKEKAIAASRYYVIRNRVAVRVVAQNYRAKKKANGGILSKDISARLSLLQRCKCACCKVDLSKTGYHLDHIMPISKGGANSDANIQLLCPTCNLQKNAKHPIDFMQSRGFLL